MRYWSLPNAVVPFQNLNWPLLQPDRRAALMSLVPGPWSLVPGPWSLVPGPWGPEAAQMATRLEAYRARAAEWATIAANSTDTQTRVTFTELATQWRLLADRTETAAPEFQSG
jgi:hypothetical protein